MGMRPSGSVIARKGWLGQPVLMLYVKNHASPWSISYSTRGHQPAGRRRDCLDPVDESSARAAARMPSAG